jgi:hypothetical protein
MLGFKSFELFVAEAPLKDALVLFNQLSARLMDSANKIEERRQKEKKAENSCSFCDHEFTYRGTDMPKGRRSFDMPNGLIQVVITCNRQKCLDEFDQYINDMSLRSRETLH